VLVTAQQRYDVIVSEPSNPYRAGVASLFTTEFLRRRPATSCTRRILRPVAPRLRNLGGKPSRSCWRLCTNVFGAVQVWSGTPVDMLLVCTAEPVSYDANALQARLNEPFLFACDTALLGGSNSLEGVIAQHIASPPLTKRLAESTKVTSTDNFNKLEYSFARFAGGRGNRVRGPTSQTSGP